MAATISTLRNPGPATMSRHGARVAAPIDPLLGRQSTTVREPAPMRSSRRPSDQVFRRRRRVVAACAVFGFAVVVLATQAVATEPGSPSAAPARTVVAQPGDTIWGIARQIAPTGDITELVDALILANGSQLRAGQVVRIP